MRGALPGLPYRQRMSAAKAMQLCTLHTPRTLYEDVNTCFVIMRRVAQTSAPHYRTRQTNTQHLSSAQCDSGVRLQTTSPSARERFAHRTRGAVWRPSDGPAVCRLMTPAARHPPSGVPLSQSCLNRCHPAAVTLPVPRCRLCHSAADAVPLTFCCRRLPASLLSPLFTAVPPPPSAAAAAAPRRHRCPLHQLSCRGSCC